MSEKYATALRAAMNTAEGPQVEVELYNFATKAPSADATIQASTWSEVLTPFHNNKVDDQFVPPIVRVDADFKPVGTVKEGDSLIYFDFRTDRAKPLTAAFLDVPFGGQVGGLSDTAKAYRPKDFTLVTMTHYDDSFNDSPMLKEAFNPAEPLENTYAEVLGKEGIAQLVCAETEKWRAVSWFKDGRRNLGYVKESEHDDIFRKDKHPTLPITVHVVQSRKVAAHIQAPQMRAKEITDMLLEGIDEGVADIFANYANADMVGHAMTDAAKFDAVVEAITVLDEQLGRLVPEAIKQGYVVFITADHGNAEEMLAKGGKASPSHTTNMVPFICIGLPDQGVTLRSDVTIGDFGPTALQLRGISPPDSWDRKTAFVGDITPDKNRKIMRLVLDGYGVRDETEGNAMAAAAAKKGSPLHMDRWMNGEDGAIAARAEASGERCGYPAGESGTTEFGHVLFDAGRTVRSDLLLIDYAIESGKFFTNPALIDAISSVKAKGSTLHVMGVLSDGKVHSSLVHLEGIMRLCNEAGLKGDAVSIHVITDGRDVPGDSSPKYIEWLEEQIQKYGVGQINSIWGRGWGKDRDNRWKRIEAAFRSLTEGTAGVFVQI